MANKWMEAVRSENSVFTAVQRVKLISPKDCDQANMRCSDSGSNATVKALYTHSPSFPAEYIHSI